MSGSLSISFVDFAAVSSTFDRVCCVSVRSFLVRNWCGRNFAVRTVGDRRRALLSIPASVGGLIPVALVANQLLNSLGLHCRDQPLADNRLVA
jgi:hypothetical protein